MTVGILNVIAVREMQVLTYVFETYELALAQAIEILKGVDCIVERVEDTGENGMRRTTFVLREAFELMQVLDLEAGKEVLSVD